MVRVADVVEHFVSRAAWVEPHNTVDRVIAGDPNRDVDRCLVTWMPGIHALRTAVERGIPLLICHEPTFWNHPDKRPGDDPGIRRKALFIEEHELAVVRVHDAWDRWPGIGIPWAWARFLGLGGEPVAVDAGGAQHRYDIEPMPLRTFAGRVAQRCAAVGEPAVQATGDPKAAVSRIGIGTGCICDIGVFRRLGCDCSIVCDDGSCYWAGIQRARDEGHPVIRVNHGTSEEPGMVTLARYINETISGLEAEHLPHGSSFRLFGVVT
jgi:putative NIF3 family GTP cyclohydrolase 1 type 2